MDLLHTGSDELVFIQTPSVSLTIKGSSSHPLFPGKDIKDKVSKLRVSCESDFQIGLSGDIETVYSECLGKSYFAEYLLSPLFYEQQQYELIIEPTEGHEVSFWHDNYNIRKNITPVGKNHSLLTGIINFGNEIGYSDLVIIVDGEEYIKLTIEVFPSKIDYQNDYQAIVSDVIEEVYNLIFDFLKKTYQSFDISSNVQSSPVEFFAIIRKIFKKFITSVDIVLRNPHHLLKTEHEITPWYKVKKTDGRTLRWLEKHPEQMQKKGEVYLVNKALTVKKYITYNTLENQLTKFMLQRTIARLRSFKIQYSKLSRIKDTIILDQIDSMVDEINRRCNTGFMKEVDVLTGKTGMSLVFNMALGYRDVYRCYLLMSHGLTVTGSIFNVSVKDLAVLYEYWCFIKLNSLMKKKYELISQDIIKIYDKGLFVSLVKGRRSRVEYKNPKTGERIVLSYNPEERKGPTVNQKPDNILSLQKHGVETNYEYVFDAKYRVNPALTGTDYHQKYHNPGPQEDDINTMHRYRDAIVYSKGKNKEGSDHLPFERTMFGAYVLFPYSNEKEYENHTFYKSIQEVNIGGLPFLPSSTRLVTNMLDELISDSPEAAFERATLPVGIEQKLAKVDWSVRDVIIETVKDEETLLYYLDHSCYYIPLVHIDKKRLPVHYLALYQTQKKFGSKACIQYYGEITELQIVPRDDIDELLGLKDDAYYKLVIKEWKKLDRPILPKEKGFSHQFTNMFLLTHSTYIPELLLHNEEEYRFYYELKRQTDASMINPESSSPGFAFGDNIISFENGIIEARKNNIVIEQCSVSAFVNRPNIYFRKLMGSLREKEKESY